MIVDPSAVTAAEQGRPAGSPGATLGKYRLDRVLGAGGMGIVWAAFDPDLERAVALKLLHSSDEPTLRSRLLREARAMARLKHPNVLTVYEVGTDHNRDYIAMEIVEGGTLDAWLKTSPPRPEILDALLASGRGLASAHAAGLVHRDFKPHNVLRSMDGHVYVTDFGLARGQIEDGPAVEQRELPALEVAASPRPRALFDAPLTQTGVIIGTPAYMAPEQFARRTPDARTDQFAFCITAWEALTGERPFRGTSLPELEQAVSAGARGLVSDLPPRIRDVLVRGLEPSPDARWPDLPTLLAALAEALEPPRRNRRALAWIAAGGVVAAGGFGYLATRSSDPARAVAAPPAGCEPADQAFATAWSSSRHAAVVKVHSDGEAIGPVLMLDDLKRRWIRAYNQACTTPTTVEHRETIACLLQVRDDTARLTTELMDPETDAGANMMGVAALGSALGSCGQSEPPDPEPPDPDEAAGSLLPFPVPPQPPVAP